MYIPQERDIVGEYTWLLAFLISFVLTFYFPAFGLLAMFVAFAHLFKLYVLDCSRLVLGFLSSVKYVVRVRDAIDVVFIYVGDLLWVILKMTVLAIGWTIAIHHVREVIL